MSPPFQRLVSVKINKKDYAGAVTQIRTTGVVIEANYQDENTPVVGTGAKVNILNEGAFDALEDLLTSTEKQFYCTIEYGGAVVFQGYSICDLNEQQFLPWANITLQFTDYLRRLDSDLLECLRQAGENSSLISLINGAIQRIGINDPLYVNSSLFETTMSAGVNDTFLEQTYLENNMFYTEANKYDNTYDALNKALKSFNAHLYFYGNKWILERIDDITRTGDWVNFPDIMDSAGYNVGSSVVSLKQEYNKQAGDWNYLDTSQIVEYDSGLKTLVLQLKDKQLDTFVFNNYTVNMLSTAELFPSAGTLALKTWYKYVDNTIFRTGYAFRGIGSYVEWKVVPFQEHAGLYYCFKFTFNVPENYVINPIEVAEVPTVLNIEYKQSERYDLSNVKEVITRFCLMINEGRWAGWYLSKQPDPGGLLVLKLTQTPDVFRYTFDVSVNGNRDIVQTISESLNLTDKISITNPFAGDVGEPTLQLPSIWDQLDRPASISFIISFYPNVVYTKDSPFAVIGMTDNIIGDIQISLAQQRIPNKLTYYINADFIKTETIDIDFFDLSNDNFSNGIETEPDDSAGALPVKTVNWVTYQHPIPVPLMDQYARVKIGNYCHTLHKLKGTILFDGHLKPFSVLTDDNLVINGTKLKLIVHGYSWDLNRGTYDIEAVEFTEETPFLEESSANVPFFLSITPSSLAWEYNDDSAQNIDVTTNMARWYIHDGSYHYGFGLTVYNGASLVTDGIYTDGMTIHVQPNDTNMTTEAKTFVVYLANESNEIMATFTGVQAFSGLNVPPIITGICSDGSFTLISFSGSGITNSNYITVSWTPILCLLTDWTMYMTVVRGGLTVGNAMYPHNFNSTTRTMDIYISEILVAGATYQVQFRTTA
jgi:hypothetical protein